MTNQPFYKLMLVTNRRDTPLTDYLHFISACATSGITSVQLREKEQTPDFLLMFGQKLKAILDPLNIPLIVNDDVELAIKLDAGGVHLGQTDGDPTAARKRLGPDKILGVSVDSHDNLTTANQLPLNYIGVGAIFPTTNKQNVTTTWGLQGLGELSPKAKHPIIAIGGIYEENAAAVLLSGANGIAVISALHDAKDPKEATRQLRHLVDHGENHA